jgi:hypothetical protein
VAEWTVGPALIQVTVSPTWMVIDLGPNTKSEIVTAGSDAVWARTVLA